jgi:hypothetical protein
VSRLLVVGLVCGIVWGAVAAVVFAAMFRGFMTAPGDAGLPLSIVLVGLYLPFLLAAGLETAAGRPSPSFGEIIGVTVASGAGLGLLGSAAIALVQRLTRNARGRS